MRLPGQIQRGVESLGQYDVSGPGRVWAAEAQAGKALSNAVSNVASAATKILGAQDEAKNLQLLQQRIMDDKVANARELAVLKNMPVIDVNDDTLPEELRDYVTNWAHMNTQQGFPPDQVQTHEIIDKYMLEQYRKRTADSLAALKGTKLESKYINAMDETVTAGISNVMEVKVKQRQDELRSNAMRNFEQAKNELDEFKALDILLDAQNSGVLLPSEVQELESKMIPDINYARSMKQLNQATNQAQIDEAKRLALDVGGLTIDQQLDFMSKAKQQEVYLEQRLAREQKQYEAEATADALEQKPGTVSRTAQQVRERKVSPSTGRAIANLARQPIPEVSDRNTYDMLSSRITLLTYPPEVSGIEDPMEEIFAIQESLSANMRGHDNNNNIVGKNLTAKDFEALSKKLGDQRKIISDVSSAIPYMRSMTGFTEFMSSLEGNTHQRMAYAWAYNQVILWKRDNPDQQAIDWARDNLTPEVIDSFKGKYANIVMRMFPQYESVFVKPDGSYDSFALLAKAKEDYIDGKITRTEYENIQNEVGVPMTNMGGVGESEADAVRRTLEGAD